jgi:hypothetical protein
LSDEGFHNLLNAVHFQHLYYRLGRQLRVVWKLFLMRSFVAIAIPLTFVIHHRKRLFKINQRFCPLFQHSEMQLHTRKWEYSVEEIEMVLIFLLSTANAMENRIRLHLSTRWKTSFLVDLH